MKFEEVLPLMREGKKAKHARMKDGEFWMCCKASFPGIEQSWLTLTKVFKSPHDKEVVADGASNSWGIERWAIFDETWEIVD